MKASKTGTKTGGYWTASNNALHQTLRETDFWFPVFVILPLCFGCEDTDQLPFPIDEVGCDKFINQLIKPGSKSQDSVDIVQDMGFDCRTETEKRVIYCKETGRNDAG